MGHGMTPEILGNTLGDHRAMFLDINVRDLLNLNKNNVDSPISRRLKSMDKRA